MKVDPPASRGSSPLACRAQSTRRWQSSPHAAPASGHPQANPTGKNTINNCSTRRTARPHRHPERPARNTHAQPPSPPPAPCMIVAIDAYRRWRNGGSTRCGRRNRLGNRGRLIFNKGVERTRKNSCSRAEKMKWRWHPRQGPMTRTPSWTCSGGARAAALWTVDGKNEWAPASMVHSHQPRTPGL